MQNSSFLSSIQQWLDRESAVESAVLFGSTAKSVGGHVALFADVDLHVISRRPEQLKGIDWTREIPNHDFCFQVIRPATGGVTKLTVFFLTGQIDIVVVPRRSASLARWLVLSRLHRLSKPAVIALNEMATCLHSGYSFLKGERRWAEFYACVARNFPGVRLTDSDIVKMADVFLAEYLWVRQKLCRGELIAAQFTLHRSLAETNLRLYRERRLRKNLPLPSFGLGRRVEDLDSGRLAECLRIDARHDCAELATAAEKALQTLRMLMTELVPQWGFPNGWGGLTSRVAATGRKE